MSHGTTMTLIGLGVLVFKTQGAEYTAVALRLKQIEQSTSLPRPNSSRFIRISYIDYTIVTNFLLKSYMRMSHASSNVRDDIIKELFGDVEFTAFPEPVSRHTSGNREFSVVAGSKTHDGLGCIQIRIE
ncbi:hypothetical protein FPQ18DRAFT_300010 [Pyronema domesticum]|nr:hypothetical protein FPQ18DRAFT_300010 [Pyronema domesticum]